ncbi:hypothetical protein [Streptomyces lydicus]|uniref:hypothetical protein n=1 Tax=Streptomyces lydicus TaxID=47763 RepID=UPI0036E62FDC
MARNGDFMTALLDSRRALTEEITSVGQRLDGSRREVLDVIATEVGNLRDEARETRNRANHAATSAGETNKAVAVLHREVSNVTDALAALQRSLDALAARLSDTAAQPLHASVVPPALDSDQASQAALSPLGAESAAEPNTRAATRDQRNGYRADGTAPAPEAQPGPEEAVHQRAAAAKDCSNPQPDRPREPLSDTPSKDGSSTALAKHDLVLNSAATVGTVNIVCHRDLWDFVQERAVDVAHFRVPGALTEEGQERVRVTLSGRSVIGLLIAMRTTQFESAPYGKDDGTWALSQAVYDRLAHDLAAARRDGGTPLTVVFDDGSSATVETPASS